MNHPYFGMNYHSEYDNTNIRHKIRSRNFRLGITKNFTGENVSDWISMLSLILFSSIAWVVITKGNLKVKFSGKMFSRLTLKRSGNH